MFTNFVVTQAIAGLIVGVMAVASAIKRRQENNAWDAVDTLNLLLAIGGFALAIYSIM